MAGRRMATNGRHYDGGKKGGGGSYKSFNDVPVDDMFHGEGQEQMKYRNFNLKNVK